MRRNRIPGKKRTPGHIDEKCLTWIIFAILFLILVVLTILMFTHD
ncbi:MAG TPA: hypothetical protein VHP54_04300 [Caproiciproducens sp.]|nr:hypothetical protein [Caproiciproducens sp.]